MGLFNIIEDYIFLKNFSLRHKLVIYFSIFIIFPLSMVGTLSYFSAEKTIKDNVSKYVADMLLQATNNIDFYFQDMENIAISILCDRNIRKAVIESSYGDYERAMALTKINYILTALMYPRKYIKQIYIVSNEGIVFSTNNSITLNLLLKQPWFTTVANGSANKLFVPTHDASSYTNMASFVDIDKVVTIVRKYADIEKNKILGVLGIDLDYRFLKNLFQNMHIKNQGNIALITDKGIIAYHKDEQLIGTRIDTSKYKQVLDNITGSYIDTIQGEKMLVVYNTSSLTGWKVIQTIPIRFLLKDATVVRNTTVIIGLLTMLMALGISIRIAYNITNPLSRLRAKMKKVEEGNLDVDVKVDALDEVGLLAQSFNRMLKEIKVLIQKIYREEREKKEIELRMLQQQINPHFLYNTLDSLNWVARMQNANNISSVITALIKLLQTTVHNGNEFIALSEELECVKSYIHIQKFRYGNIFEVRYDVDEGLLDKPVLKLLLQPLVENALQHGLDSVDVGGIITITGRLEGDKMILGVKDNGKGMEPEKIHAIMESSRSKKNSLSRIGIYNVNQRIKLYYGEEYGLQIKSKLGEGTLVEVVIPIAAEAGGVNNVKGIDSR